MKQFIKVKEIRFDKEELQAYLAINTKRKFTIQLSFTTHKRDAFVDYTDKKEIDDMLKKLDSIFL